MEIAIGDHGVGNGWGEHFSLGTKVQLRQASIGVSHPKQLACVFHHSICLTLREPRYGCPFPPMGTVYWTSPFPEEGRHVHVNIETGLPETGCGEHHQMLQRQGPGL